jgi:hypothetical protein
MTRPQTDRIARLLVEPNQVHCRRLSTRWKGRCFQRLQKSVPAHRKARSQPRMKRVTAHWRKARSRLATKSLPACSTEPCLDPRGVW